MLQLSKVLVPYDFSSFSKVALAHGLVMAQRHCAELHVIYVEVLHGEIVSNSTTSSEKAEALRARIEEDNRDLGERLTGQVIHYAVGHDLAAGPAINTYALEYDIDLIVMGTHGRRGLKHMFLGSVAEEIVRIAPCPVMIVRAHDTSTGPYGEFRNILVPVDFSAQSTEALAHAMEIATLSHAEIELLHVIPVPAYPTLNDAAFISIYTHKPDMETKAIAHLHAYYKKLTDAFPGKVKYTVTHGTAADEISQHLVENGHDLMVIGTHGQTGLNRFLLGSVTAKVIRRAPIPVFIVKSFGKSLGSALFEDNVLTHADKH